MTKEEIIELADQCVFDIVEPDEYHDKREIVDSGNRWITERIERFANLVAAKERERCAKECEKLKRIESYEAVGDVAKECAEAIRSLK